MVFSTAQEAPADWIFASKYICLFLWTFHNIVAPRLASTGDRFKKKYAGLEFRSTFVFISLNWFLQTCGFYEWNKHCEWSFTFGILVHIFPLNERKFARNFEHNCKESSVTFVSRCWQGDDSDKLNWYWSRVIGDFCCTTQTSWITTRLFSRKWCNVGEYMECKCLYFDPPP